MRIKHCFILLLTLITVSCGTDGKHFSIDGQFLHLNQGEFYVYTPDGSMEGIDTIKVEAGRFTYEMECDRPTTLMLIFPNFTEQPVFAEPGKSVTIKGDASHLKEMSVKGTDDNKLMNSFREQIASASPPEIKKYARQFIEDHPESAVGTYLVRKYFIQTASPDYPLANRLIKTMLARQDKNGYLRRLQNMIKGMGNVAVGKPVPAFTAYDINGRSVSNATVSASPTTVICTWATWSYESISMLQQLCTSQKTSGGHIRVIAISADASAAECRRTMKSNNIDCTVICDQNMIDSRLFKLLGLSSIPDNILIQDGRVTAHSLATPDLMQRLSKAQ